MQRETCWMFSKSSFHTISRILCHRSWISWSIEISYLLANPHSQPWTSASPLVPWDVLGELHVAPKVPPEDFSPQCHQVTSPYAEISFFLGTLLWTYLVLHAFVSFEAISSTKCFSIIEVLWRYEPKVKLSDPPCSYVFSTSWIRRFLEATLPTLYCFALFCWTLFRPREILRPFQDW